MVHASRAVQWAGSPGLWVLCVAQIELITINTEAPAFGAFRQG